MKLKFSDLTEDDLSKLVGPKGEKGPRGQRGKPGKDFSFDESKEEIESIIDSKKDSFKLNFSDLTEDEKSELKGEKGDKGERGLRGAKGSPGESFNFDDCKESILILLSDLVSEKSDLFKIKFSDLTEDEKSELKGEKGSRGQRGKPGRDFDFDENKDQIRSQVESFVDSIKDGFKLNFSDLSDEEKSELTLKFSHLTEDQKIELKGERGSRGQRGKQGIQGEKGDTGEKGEVGLRGLPGPIGPMGVRGLAGQDGKDAPYITEISINETRDDFISFVFAFSDGTFLETNRVELPSTEKIFNNYYSAIGGSGGGGSEITVLDSGSELGVAEQIDFEENLNVTYDEENKKATIESVTKIFDEGILISDKVKSIDFVGENVEVLSPTKISDWPNLEDVDSMSDYEAETKSTVEVRIGTPSKFSLTRTAQENIAKFDLVTLFDETRVKKAGIDSYLDAVVAGVAINSANIGQDVEFIIFGVIEDPSFSFPIKEPLFLNSTGNITNTPHSTSGKFLSKIGKSYGNGAIFIELNDPRGIA